MIKIFRALIVALLLIMPTRVNAWSSFQSLFSQSLLDQDLTSLNVKGYPVRSLLREGMSTRDVNSTMDLLKRDGNEIARLETLGVFSSQVLGKSNTLFLAFEGNGHTTVVGKAMNRTYVLIDNNFARVAMAYAKRYNRANSDAHVIRQIQVLFSNDMHFLAENSNDSLEVMFADSLDDMCIGRVDIHDRSTTIKFEQLDLLLEVAVTIGTETRRLYAFDDGNGCEYYDDQGANSTKLIAGSPTTRGSLRLGFGLIRHPILGAYKFHPGVDWTIAGGSAVRSVGDGCCA
jgi:murein DD-endopeptidase MepM/ murein hydrolase activator NlpD